MTYKSKRNTNHFFEAVGLGANTGRHAGQSTLYSKRTGYRVETVESIMQRWGDDRINLQRIDVESAEYDVLDALPYDQIGQLYRRNSHVGAHARRMGRKTRADSVGINPNVPEH